MCFSMWCGEPYFSLSYGHLTLCDVLVSTYVCTYVHLQEPRVPPHSLPHFVQHMFGGEQDGMSLAYISCLHTYMYVSSSLVHTCAYIL